MERPPIIVTGSTYPKIACDVATLLEADFCTGIKGTYKDSEINPQLSESVRGRNVFIVQSTCPPDVNKAYMELFFMVSECVRSSADKITVVSPYSGYARGDRFNEKRTTIPIADVLDILKHKGAQRFVTVDIHQEASLGSFHGPVDHLYSSDILVPQVKKDIEREELENIVITATDQGGTKMVEVWARLLRNIGVDIAGTAYAIQERDKITNEKKIIDVTGNVKNANLLIIDDMVASGESAINATNKFREKGAKRIRLIVPHGLFLDWDVKKGEPRTSLERLRNSSIEQVMTTDTVCLREEILSAPEYVKVYSIAPLIASAISCIHEGKSITDNLRRNLSLYC